MTRTGDDDCNVGAGYMTCFNNTRIYNEDEDGGHTITLLEGLKHCMVFNDDGTPRQLEGLVDPIDARDLEQTFWLRSETDSNGSIVFKNIEIMGDIDFAFFGTESVANLARTMINSNPRLAEQARAYDSALTDGAALVQYLANLPITANSGDITDDGPWTEQIAGMTTYVGLQKLSTRLDKTEGRVARDFLAALSAVVKILGPLMGGRANMLLDPANARSGDKTAENVLFENLFGYGLVPLVQTGQGDVNVSDGTIAEAVVQINEATRSNIIEGTPIPEVAKSLGAGATAECQVLVRQLANDPTNLENVKAVFRFVEAHPVVVDPTLQTASVVRKWASDMLKALAVNPTATQKEVDLDGRRGLAISPENRQLREGKLPANFRRASPLGLDEPRAGQFNAEAQISSSASTMLEQTPIMQAITAAHMQARVGAHAGGAGQRGFDSLFADDDEDSMAHVGALFPGGAEGREAVDRLRDRRGRITGTGSLLSSGVDPRLRFGALSHNLEQLNMYMGSGLERLVASAYFFAPWRRQTLESWLSRNTMPNFGIIGFRIGLYDMALGIKVSTPVPPLLPVLGCKTDITAILLSVQSRYADRLHGLWQQSLHAGRRCHDPGPLRQLHVLREAHCGEAR
jgi:hypothetical protein